MRLNEKSLNILQLDGNIKVQADGKVIKLRDEHELQVGSSSFEELSRPEFVPKLEETIIAEYEMSVVPRSLCAEDGSLYIEM